ncbi:alpha/beta hydrolase [Hydrogenivirga sp.]
MRILLVLFLLLSFLRAEPVSIRIDYEGKKLKANADLAVPKDKNPRVAVLWVHGLFQTHKMQEPISVQREAWVSAGYPVLSPTLTLGVDDRKGPYDCSYPLDHEYELNIKEIKLWIEWLKGRGIERIVLAGHSMGGQEVIHTAERLRDPAVVGLLAVAPAKGLRREHPLLSEAERLYREGKGKKLLKTSFFYCRKTEVSARTLFTYYGVDRNIGKSLQKLRIPVLVVWGGEDTRVRDLPGFLEPYVKDRKNIRVEVIDYADHFFRDLASEDLSAIAIEFFGEVLKR